MNFEKLFKILSYAAVFCGFFSLWISGTFGITGTGIFIAVMIAAWFLEGSKWQISERLGTVLIVLALPVFYAGWKYQFFGLSDSGAMLAGILARLILSLTAIKLLQKKSDRDWMFLYLMSFFEVLLAAGLSISALYLISFVFYIFIMVCTIILFEIKKSDRAANAVDLTSSLPEGSRLTTMPFRRLPAMALVLIGFIILFATPMFFLLPRVGGAGLGGNRGGVATATGFSDTVRLGDIGRIQQNDEVTMRVRIENREQNAGILRWRGIALDTFDNQSWSRTKASVKEEKRRGERDFIQVDYASGKENLTIQTVYLEPLDTPVLFSLHRALGVQGNFPVLFRDVHGAITFPRVGERISYKVLSDRTLPDISALRTDDSAYRSESNNYRQLPSKLDERIEILAEQITRNIANRYDAARAVESYLQNSFGYTLEQKSGGDQPLADFLFNVKEGHCEYFATAMALMLRTQGIATRVVNGFQQGEYNETADVYVVRQKNAHSWVEVYFPGENAWVPFDPTPFAAQNLTGNSKGISAQFGKYLEALETFWIQYFVAYDNQEQRSLFTSVKRSIADYQTKTSGWANQVIDRVTEWWKDVRGEKGLQTSLFAVSYAIGLLAVGVIGLLAIVLLYRKFRKLNVWQRVM
ncbi:MAG: DUF3488 and transglutaminase-like domain-containing protein, partial [Acidobacteriota bacterium]|nr:DUF3488 and transglutaminase-like domain-containing protein [Acidobacteriota bacterium]